jgi:hypothetical protein
MWASREVHSSSAIFVILGSAARSPAVITGPEFDSRMRSTASVPSTENFLESGPRGFRAAGAPTSYAPSSHVATLQWDEFAVLRVRDAASVPRSGLMVGRSATDGQEIRNRTKSGTA